MYTDGFKWLYKNGDLKRPQRDIIGTVTSCRVLSEASNATPPGAPQAYLSGRISLGPLLKPQASGSVFKGRKSDSPGEECLWWFCEQVDIEDAALGSWKTQAALRN